jgi:hypothetical protein
MRVRDVEPQLTVAKLASQRRFPPCTVSKLQLLRIGVQIPAQQQTQKSARNRKTLPIYFEVKTIGAVDFVSLQQFEKAFCRTV